VGDISPHNVVINDNGQIKVIATCSLPNELNNFQKVVEDTNAKVYLGIAWLI
jgi:RIO-like serine/threonine protein kinase